MSSTTTWTCGCGAAADAGRCSVCGWAAATPGQPDRSASRWLPVLAGVTAVVFAGGLGGLVRDDVDRDFSRTGRAITEDVDDPVGGVGADELEGRPGRELPASLGELLPTALDGWESIRIDGFSGALDLDATASIGGDEAATLEQHRLTKGGFARAEGAMFRIVNQQVAGVVLVELASPAAAQEYVDSQAALVDSSPGVTSVDLPGMENEVAWRYPTGDGGEGLDVVYRVDQLVVHEVLAVLSHTLDPEAIGPLHAAVTSELAT